MSAPRAATFLTQLSWALMLAPISQGTGRVCTTAMRIAGSPPRVRSIIVSRVVRKRGIGMTIGLANRALLAFAVAGLTAAASAQETTAPVHVSAARSVPAETLAAAYVDKSWRPPRTSWGHPSFEGAWSTGDFRGVPMSRPREQGERTSLTPDEFAKRAQEIESGRDFSVNVGTFLRHEFGLRTFGYTSMIVDPPNGQMPALTAHGQELSAQRTPGTFAPGPLDSFDDFSLYDRCITRAVLGSL